jgi:hypothetical protein
MKNQKNRVEAAIIRLCQRMDGERIPDTTPVEFPQSFLVSAVSVTALCLPDRQRQGFHENSIPMQTSSIIEYNCTSVDK